jgi:hypothetical protein
MATLLKHGKEIGRIEFLTKTKAYFDSGDILINRGFGWKEYGKVKTGKTPMEAYQNAKNRLNEWKQQFPLAAHFMSEFHLVAGLKDRWKLYQALIDMPEDPDGIWSCCCDGYGDNLSASVDEIVDLCRLYAQIENKLADLG